MTKWGGSNQHWKTAPAGASGSKESGLSTNPVSKLPSARSSKRKTPLATSRTLRPFTSLTRWAGWTPSAGTHWAAVKGMGTDTRFSSRSSVKPEGEGSTVCPVPGVARRKASWNGTP
ncbi:hypothetical protein [Corallococcus terminator]|nr:hypothetical protein [Corallococcus terminator]